MSDQPSHSPVVPVLGVLDELEAIAETAMVAMGLSIAISTRASLPRFARDRVLRPGKTQAIARGLRRVLRPIAALFRPRWEFMFWPLVWRSTGIGITLAAGALSLPIPIPFANMIPALALINFACGLLQRDGIAVCVGHLFTVATYAYLVVIWDTAWGIIAGLLGG